MQSLEAQRRAAYELALKKLGIKDSAPQSISAQRKGLTMIGEIVNLPDLRLPVLQCLDPSSPDFGKFYYLPGYDELGDPNHPLAP